MPIGRTECEAKYGGPIKINITKIASFAVFSKAWLINDHDRRRRIIASTNAPTAPIAPPSVGVAIPMKMVPNTKKMRITGGISAKTKRSASWDKSPHPVMRLIQAKLKALSDATTNDVIAIWSVGALDGLLNI